MNDKSLKKRPGFIAFLDESGDHSLENIDSTFPVFVLSLVLVKRERYINAIIPELNQLKLKYWDHEGINFHSRDIRKKQGAFSELVGRGTFSPFLEDLSNLMTTMEYELFSIIIHKEKLTKKYKQADNPYELSLKFLMERVVYCVNKRNVTALPIIAEARGKNEDNQLKAVFFDLISRGTEDIPKEKVQQCQFTIQFEKKITNIGGIQLADLCAYPCGRYAIDPEKNNPAFDIVQQHIYNKEQNTSFSAWGMKIFP